MPGAEQEKTEPCYGLTPLTMVFTIASLGSLHHHLSRCFAGAAGTTDQPSAFLRFCPFLVGVAGGFCRGRILHEWNRNVTCCGCEISGISNKVHLSWSPSLSV